MSEPNNFVRWYDSRPKISQAARLLFIFPDEIKSIISEAILLIADKEFRQEEKERQVRSLGREKILGLHQSKNRRREYDQNPHLHQAMNYLYILSEDNREFMAEHILKMVQYIQCHLETCQLAQRTPDLKEVAEIVHIYIKSGDESVKLFLKQLRHQFYDKLRDGKQSTVPDPIVVVLDKISKQDDSGMKITKLD
jgi:hypothetical protein